MFTYQLQPNQAEFVILSFEGPDPYAQAGGLGVRAANLSRALAAQGYRTHLLFVGDPDLPGHECHMEGRLQLHRWCQWISRHHSNGVYDGKKLNWLTTPLQLRHLSSNRLLDRQSKKGAA